MAESSGKYKLTVASHNQMLRDRDSNQMLRDIHKSLRHLNVREPVANHQHNQDVSGNDLCQQGQSSFEQQLALGNNINALTQSAAGERRSYPRATKQFAIEELRKPFPVRNGTLLSSGGGYVNDGYYTKVDGNHQSFKSSSFTDLSRGGKELLNSPIPVQFNNQQQKLNILVSYGFDEVCILFVIFLVLLFLDFSAFHHFISVSALYLNKFKFHKNSFRLICLSIISISYE